MHTVTIKLCAGGATEIPDFTGDVSALDNRTVIGDLIIQQEPAAGTLVTPGSYPVNVLVQDQAGNRTVCRHLVNVVAEDSAPILTCPAARTEYLLGGQFIVPDYSSELTIAEGCGIRDEMTITQSPAAGTIITGEGSTTITFTVVSGGLTSVCSFIVTRKAPVIQIPENPIYIWTNQLLGYWPLSDLGTDAQDLWDMGQRILLITGLPSTTPRDLTNAGEAIINDSDTMLLCISPFTTGTATDVGSLICGASTTAYAYYPDDTGLRLQGTSFTIRMCVKIGTIHGQWRVVSKLSTVGYAMMISKSGSNYYSKAYLQNSTTTLQTSDMLASLALNRWYHLVMTFERTTGLLSFYVDAELKSSATSSGFSVGADTTQFRVGQPGSTGSVEANTMACWNLDDTGWSDSVGGRTLSAVGSPTLVAGKISNAVHTVNHSYLQRPDDAALQLVSTDFSIRFWFSSNGAGAVGLEGAIVRKSGSYEFLVTTLSGAMKMGFRAGAAYTFQNSNTSLAIFTWHHCVWTYSASTQTLKFYLNNVLDSTFTGVTIVSAANPFQVGYWSGFGLTDQHLKIDELRIWTVELTAANVVTDYNGGNGTSCPAGSGTPESVYHDELGIWTYAWSPSRVLLDYENCFKPR